MTDNEFDKLVGYCYIHCETERALFHKDDVNKMLELAGRSERVDIDFISVHYEMKELCSEARRRRKEEKVAREKERQFERYLAAIEGL